MGTTKSMGTTTRRPPLILVADDDLDDLYFIRAAFSEAVIRPELVFANNGQVVFDYLASATAEGKVRYPDLIFLDLNMPVVDGKETLQWLKSTPKYCHIPVLIYTTSQSEADISEAYRLGANSYILKPGTMTEVIETMESIANYWFNTVRLEQK